MIYILEKKELDQTLTSWSENFDVFAPLKVEKYSQFVPIKSSSELTFKNPHNTRFPPKALFLPQTEVLQRYCPNLNQLQEVVQTPKPLIIFGIRPCDAQAVTLLDTVFNTQENVDPYWKVKRDASIVIGMGCTNPCQTCFCTTVGYGPFNHDGLDALITEIDEKYFIEVLTEKGKSLFTHLPPATKDQELQLHSLQLEVKENMPIAFETKNLKQKLDKIFDNDYWQTISESCLGCGVCTFLCPTCFCFDIVDEVQRNERIRNWDTCMFRIYSQEASGHNPRPTRRERTRQRLMHKYSYWLDHIGKIGCTGCGRCVRYCPVGLDIRAMIRTASNVKSEVIND